MDDFSLLLSDLQDDLRSRAPPRSTSRRAGLRGVPARPSGRRRCWLARLQANASPFVETIRFRALVKILPPELSVAYPTWLLQLTGRASLSLQIPKAHAVFVPVYRGGDQYRDDNDWKQPFATLEKIWVGFARLGGRWDATISSPNILRSSAGWAFCRCLVSRRPLPRYFRPDRLVFQDSVATSAGSQPFDPAAA